ncbi:MAG: RIP metalloprotease RseP [Thermodesulfovibrio sp.]|nr:RIP metalloprotease RseP [Thermodesulfovibrio sp.]
MNLLYGTFAAVFLFSAIILTHEFGHFIAARLSNVKVEKFSLGMGPTLFSFYRGETQFSLGLFPIGGYVKLLGEGPDAPVPVGQEERSFSHQRTHIKAFIAVAGALSNIICAFVILVSVYLIGIQAIPAEVLSVQKDSPAERSGIRPGDMIKSVNRESVTTFEEAIRIVQAHPDEKIPLELMRDNQAVSLIVIPENRVGVDVLKNKKSAGYLGITATNKTVTYRKTLPDAIVMAFEKSGEFISLVWGAVGSLIVGKLSASDLGGPVMVAAAATKQLAAGVGNYLFTLAFLCINIGVVNLLPIPAFDGGFLLLFAIEAIRGKAFSGKTLLTIQRIGMSLIIILTVLVFYNDLIKVIAGELAK